MSLAYNLKQAWFGILSDIKDNGFRKEVFTKDNRLLYIGFTVILFTLIIFAYDIFIIGDDERDDFKPQYAMVPLNDLRRMQMLTH